MSFRRYAIEVTDVDTDQIELLIAADWTEEEKRIALAQILRLVGLSDGSTSPEPQSGKAKSG
jgi:hypothetical protein